MSRRRCMRGLSAVVLLALLSGCASSRATSPAEPLAGRLTGSVSEVLNVSIQLLLEQGYVVRHADSDLGRVEAVLARWPGYALRLRVEPTERGSRIEMIARQQGRPLPPGLLEPWLMTLRSRLEAG
ncbi:hypothetical protein OM427_23970 [Halomonas sp. 18H]|uniref:hypothetical protein n=1 Tax=Halomonas almeriensis TaxID=308163 RepID=UPI00222EB8EE|nr:MULTISPECIES: hypothetical protein [Halomonas]MCW4152578.1 hypothetical protein [Halomonas sp. 18H]MDN3553846.1 hypothetical protein [Halomonas almeriensis]